jgi:hypothetical protein
LQNPENTKLFVQNQQNTKILYKVLSKSAKCKNITKNFNKMRKIQKFYTKLQQNPNNHITIWYICLVGIQVYRLVYLDIIFIILYIYESKLKKHK